MRVPRFANFCKFTFLALASATLAQDEIPSQPKTGARVCIATVGNVSTTAAFVERLTKRLARSLKQNKINAVMLDSRTTNRYPLELSIENGEEAKKKDCDYILLSQIRDPQQHPLEPRVPEISIGGRAPSVDASEPAGSYRENLQVAFTLFRIGRFKPVLDTVVLERPSANASDTLLPAMDHEANRVGRELKQH